MEEIKDREGRGENIEYPYDYAALFTKDIHPKEILKIKEWLEENGFQTLIYPENVYSLIKSKELIHIKYI